jgi:hypothetical protein
MRAASASIASRYVIELYLPLFDNKGKRFPKRYYQTIRTELTARFGGITAYTRAPAVGLWKKPGERAMRDDIVIYEVIATRLDQKWWSSYRRQLEQRFEQDELIVRAHAVRLL